MRNRARLERKINASIHVAGLLGRKDPERVHLALIKNNFGFPFQGRGHQRLLGVVVHLNGKQLVESKQLRTRL
jgi:hypothetical protein